MNNNLSKADALLIILLLLFVSDAIANFFKPIPIFVSGLIVVLPLMIFNMRGSKGAFFYFYLLYLSFVVPFSIHTIVLGIEAKNVADLLFIFFTFSSYFFLSGKKLSKKAVHTFFFFSFFLLGFSFLGIDVAKESTINAGSEDIEYMREYNQGLFRISHVGSYFFSFILIFYVYLYSKTKELVYALLGFVCFCCVIYIGSRTTIVTILLLVFVFYFRLKYLPQLVVFLVAGTAVVLNIKVILLYFEGTIFFQYFSIIATFNENFSRLSRVIIWSSWWEEISNFSLGSFMIGNSFHNSFIANVQNINENIWFHNDFLSIAYSYGLFALLAYLSFFTFIYLKNESLIKNNIYIFVCFFSMPLAGVFNGFYYYYTFFIFYLFIYLLQYEKEFLDENSSLGNKRHSKLIRWF